MSKERIVILTRGPLKWYTQSEQGTVTRFANAGSGVLAAPVYCDNQKVIGPIIFIPDSVLLFRKYEEHHEEDEDEGDPPTTCKITELLIEKSPSEELDQAMQIGWKKA